MLDDQIWTIVTFRAVRAILKQYPDGIQGQRVDVTNAFNTRLTTESYRLHANVSTFISLFYKANCFPREPTNKASRL